MKKMSKTAQAFFRDCGKKGGKKRAQSLSSKKRIEIASQAACSRWGKKVSSSASAMPSIRLDMPNWHDPVYLEEILSHGEVKDWLTLYQKISNNPLGEIAEALKKVVNSNAIEIPTIKKLWQRLLT